MLQPGTEIAGYRIVGVLGRGGMGHVYEAMQISLERTVALKILSDDLGMDEAFRARFKREGRIQAGISHPHIVSVHEAGEVDGHLFIAMQLVRGPTLKHMITKAGLDAPLAIALLSQVAKALDAAHAAGLTHRDVKPQNVLIGAGEHAYLADFGLTKPASDASGYTRTGQFVGTIDYVSPEQITGKAATPASDVYALGAILYESLARQVPYPRETEAAVLFAHISADPPRLSAVRDDLPADLDAVIARAMDKDPTQRPMSAGSLMEQAYAALAEQHAPTRRSRVMPAAGEPSASSGEASTTMPEAEEESFPPTMESGSRLIPPESDPAFAVPDHLPEPPELTPEPEPEPAPTPDGEARAASRTSAAKQRRRRRLPILGAAAALVIAGAGIAAGVITGGHKAATATPPPLTGSAANSDVAVRFPSTWTPSAASPLGDALRLSEPVELKTAVSGGGRFAAGLVDGAVTPGLLPTTVAKAVSGTLPKPDRVRVGALSAYRYKNVSLRGVGGPVTVLAVPTTTGVLTLACAGSGAAAAGCTTVAATATLRDGRPLNPGADATFARQLSQTIARINRDRTAARRRLASAAGPKRQAEAATAAATAYRRAATALQRMSPGPADRALHTALRADATRTAQAYEALASAARREDRPAYHAASTSVHQREVALDRALTRLKAAGYRVG